MDWPAARRLLIGLFLAVNAFLALQIWGPAPALPGAWLTVTRRDARDVRERLARFGMYVRGDLPPDPPELPLIRVRAIPPDADALAARWFPGGPPQAATVESGGGRSLPAGTPLRARRYEEGGRTLVVEDAGRAVFRQALTAGEAPPVPPGREPDGQALRELGLAMLPEQGFDPSLHATLPPRADADRRTTLLRWPQQLNDRPLFGTGLSVRVSENARDGTREWAWEAARVQVLNRGEPRQLIPGHEALLRLALELSDRGEAGGTVDRITLGYLARPIPAESWEAPPAWEIEFSDGRLFHLNAITGAPEQRVESPAGEL